MYVHFNADEINLINQFGGHEKTETCANFSAALLQLKDNGIKQIVSTILKKLNVLSEESCTELTTTVKRRKLTERDHSVKVRLAKAEILVEEQAVSKRDQQKCNGNREGADL